VKEKPKREGQLVKPGHPEHDCKVVCAYCTCNSIYSVLCVSLIFSTLKTTSNRQQLCLNWYYGTVAVWLCGSGLVAINIKII